MSAVRAIRTEADYQAALSRIDALMDAELGTPESEEIDVLADLVGLYEARHVPMGYPTPVEAIRFRMEQDGLSQRDLVPLIGSRSKVSEVLSEKRPLTMQMARALHLSLGIPADVLLQRPGAKLPTALEGGIDWKRFPTAEMVKRGWVVSVGTAEEIMRGLIARAGGEAALPAALFRKSDAQSDPYALKAWCWEVLARARATSLSGCYRAGTVTPAFLRSTAKLSWSEKGPRLAVEFLAKHGVHLVPLRHLPRTHLDGAALQLVDGTPVIGLTVRYDRLDNFWFCLLHELAHVGRHMDGKNSEAFIDDLNLAEVSGAPRDRKEDEADEWAQEALIPGDVWSASRVKEAPAPKAVEDLAQRLSIHPAIIAGRVRRETGNFKLLSHFVGNGQVRHQLGL